MKQANLFITTKRDTQDSKGKIWVPKFLVGEMSQSLYPISNKMDKLNLSLPTDNQEMHVPKSPVSVRQSVLSGIEDWDISQTLTKLSDYIERHENNPKPNQLLVMCNHLVNLCKGTNFELEFHSK